MNKHEIISILDEDGIDLFGEFLDDLLVKAKSDLNAKIHYTFLMRIFELLQNADIDVLSNEKTQIDIKVNGFVRTKRYQIVTLLQKKPIYELRYALSGNEHLRLLFFPIEYKSISFYVFSKAFIKTRVPSKDDTNKMRDLMHTLYLKVYAEPQNYLEEEE
ncbi:hypothetical protein [Viridibacillus arvi]|uniref:hypothetical protein n=1 Tax=Viridibacillus arvi TaxID=263475 RepID=UPI0034CF7808